MPTDVLIWTCVAVFAATAAITILALINVIKIKDEFMTKLFYTLIIEVVVAGVLVFKNALVEQPLNIIRITSPLKNITVEKGKSLFVNGFCQKQANVSFKGSVDVSGKNYLLTDFKTDDRNLFSSLCDVPDTFTNANALIRVKLISKNEVSFQDSVAVLLTIK